MLKQKIEDKGHQDSITHDGKTYRRSDYEDSEHPGYTKPGRLYSSFELLACGRWGLIAPSGHLFSAHLPVELKPDPTRVSREDAPEALLRAVAEAEKNLKAAEAKVTAALAERATAEAAQADAAWKQDARRFNAAIIAAQVAEQHRLDAEMTLPPIRVELSRVNQRLKFWMDDEGLRRQGRAEEPAPTAF